jgi:hypothetical protein
MAAVGEEATKTASIFTDGLITVSTPDKSKKILDNFDKHAQAHDKDPNTMEKIGKLRYHTTKTMMKRSNLLVSGELHP